MNRYIFAILIIFVLCIIAIGWAIGSSIEGGNEYARQCEPYRYQPRSELLAHCIYYFENRWVFLDPDILNHEYPEQEK